MRFNLPAYFIGDLDTEVAGFRAIAHPEVSVWTAAVVMQIRNVDGFAVKNTDVAAAETVRQSRKLGKYL